MLRSVLSISVGVTKGKRGSLTAGLIKFKRLSGTNETLANALQPVHHHLPGFEYHPRGILLERHASGILQLGYRRTKIEDS